MNLEILVSLDGEQLVLNDDLQGTISNLVTSYIKQKIMGVKEKVKQRRILKPWTPKEIEQLKIYKLNNPTMKINKLAQFYATEFGRTKSSVSNKLADLR